MTITAGSENWAGSMSPATASGSPISPQAVEFFESRVRPILADHCFKCHGPTKQAAGLRLDGREAVLAGGDSGPAAVALKPDDSLLIRAVAHTHPELKMPPSGKLAEPAVAVLRQWIADGVPWPAKGEIKGSSAAATDGRGSASLHWSFQPIGYPPIPAVRNQDWTDTPVDRFIMARLDAAGIEPSARAERRILIRRATFDLWGMPPTAEEVQAFVSDPAPDAFARLVDRLLASPRYGERWGRHWLDVARYADTKGYVFTQDRRYPYAYTYRDYVVDAFNSDLGYDQFLLQQIAADQLVAGEDSRPLAAMGFLTVGRRFLLDQNEIIDDRIDVVSRGLLGLTVTCARCHDHKFDPIPTADYYSLYGVFASSVEPAELPLLKRPGGPGSLDFEKKMAGARKMRDDYVASRRNEVQADLADKFSLYLKAAHDLGFDPRNAKLDERAGVNSLNPRRLRGVIALWKRKLDGNAGVLDPLVGVWRAFGALPPAQYAARARDVHRDLLKKASGDPKTAAIHPLVVKEVLKSAPASQNELVARYVALFGQLETRSKTRKRVPADAPAGSLPDPEWESLRLALYGDTGVLALSAESIRMVLDQSQRGALDRLNGKIDGLKATHPASPARAMVLNDAPQLHDPHVFLRGNPGRPGPAVPRRFLELLAGKNRQPFKKGSGRLELAQAITDRGNPLAPRVLVNRVWQWHFGKGLVTTPSDFGLRSDPPSHPDLLDYLASEFIASGWSIKSLHRLIMLSSTYQQRSDPRSNELERDPENRLVWRFNRQRLDFESMRDALLASAGSLDPVIGGPATPITEPPFSGRRTLYGFIDRQNLDGLYRTFDFAVPDATSPRRYVTTVPQQALFLMNSPFLHEQSRRLAALVHAEGSTGSSASASSNPGADAAEGVRRLYLRTLGRSPDAGELSLGIDFVSRRKAAGTADASVWKGSQPANGPDPLSAWEQLAQVLLLTNEFMFVD